MNPLQYLTEGIWRDEAFSYLLAKHSFIEIVFLTVKDFNPPLYYFLLHIWMILFGSSEIALRSLSLTFYVLGIFCIYEIFKVILNKRHKQAALYTGICMLNPLLFYYAFEARMYSMLFCLAMVSSFYYLKKDWRNYTIIAVIGLYTHYFMALVILVQLIHTIVPLLRKKLHWRLVLELRPFFIIALCFLPWALFFVFQNTAATSQYWISQLKPFEAFMLPGFTFSGIEKDFAANFSSNFFYQHLVIGFSIFFFLMVLLGIGTLRKKEKEYSTFLYLVLLSTIPLALLVVTMGVKPLYVPRYVIFVSAAISMVIVLALSEIKGLFRNILIIIFVAFSIQFQLIQLHHRVRDTTKKVVEKIKPLVQEGDAVFVTSELQYMTAQYYFGENNVFIYGKKYSEIPSYVGKVLIPPSAVAPEYPRFPNKAFVITGNNTFEIQSQF